MLRTAIAVTVALVAAASSGSVSVGAGLSARLAWAPPALTSPITVQVTNANRRLFLDNARDYRLHITERLKRELWIEGGRNVQIENVRVERAHDGVKGDHADCIQIQQGVGHLRLDGFTCTTDRQGIFLGDHDGAIRSADLRRVNMYGSPGKHLFWQTTPSFDLAVSDVWLGISRDFTAWAPFGFWVYPQRDGKTYGGAVDRRRRAVVSRDGKRLWFVGSRIRGVVRRSVPGSPEFVPADAVGTAYASPGYARR